MPLDSCGPAFSGMISPKITQMILSMDWFKGNFTGKPHIYWENLWFPVDFPLNQSIDSQIFWPIPYESGGIASGTLLGGGISTPLAKLQGVKTP